MPGHKDAKKALAEAVADLRAGIAPERESVLGGPRGNDKTSLLRHWQAAAKENSPTVDALWLTPKLPADAGGVIPGSGLCGRGRGSQQAVQFPVRRVLASRSPAPLPEAEELGWNQPCKHLSDA